MVEADFSVLDLLDLPKLEREVFLYLARNGSAEGRLLGEELGYSDDVIQQALTNLVSKHRIRFTSDGLAEPILGRVIRRTTLPADIWPAFLTADRLFTEQDIATLRTAIPMLQFARARMSTFADHGPPHALRVRLIALQLGYLLGLNASEHHFLSTAALFHDIGNIVERERHHVISQETIEKLAVLGKLPFTFRDAEVIGLVCRWHRREYDPQRVDRVGEKIVRTGLLASILRVSDAMDIDHRRSDYGPSMRDVLTFFFANELPYWTSLEEIWGVRLACTPEISVQIFTRKAVEDNIQVNALRKDMASTPLDFPIRITPISEDPFTPNTHAMKSGKVLIAFPFEPHSLIMSAISRRHLMEYGYSVELLCYPDTEGGPAWLWGETLGKMVVSDYRRILIIGDRPVPELDQVIVATIANWQQAGVQVSLLNRYEANWQRNSQLNQAGVEIILGGDWSYFWGEQATRADMTLGRIAALCIHDPNLSSVGVTSEEQALMHGVLARVYEATRQPARDTADWSALAEPILEHISMNDHNWFSVQEESFLAAYASPPQPSSISRRTLRFDGEPGIWPQAYYWALEAAIEGQGRTTHRGIQYKRPYAIATWPIGDSVELFAINHWREEEALPIRLLYPVDLGLPPQGTESTIHVRLPAGIAAAVIDRLQAVCDQQ